ncbi:MAG TPA: hypothetical protein VEX64_00050 [Pyrinomonadaceae bacterium]|nr:hypothetical protein [Pyrinomonadaceae bacterium]
MAAILFAVDVAGSVMKRDTGTPEMQNISNAVKGVAGAFLARRNKTIGASATSLAAGL